MHDKTGTISLGEVTNSGKLDKMFYANYLGIIECEIAYPMFSANNQIIQHKIDTTKTATKPTVTDMRDDQDYNVSRNWTNEIVAIFRIYRFCNKL